MNFVALDVETANADLSSICQIGIAHFSEGKLVRSLSQLINPKDYFDGWNVSVHGILEDDVLDSPTFGEYSANLIDELTGKIVVTHSHFDRTALGKAFYNINLEMPSCQWLDTAKVARRAWAEYSQRGYGLANLAEHIGHDFKHHDAEEDAIAAGAILLAAEEIHRLGVNGWITRCGQPITESNSSGSGSNFSGEGDPDGMLYGETIVFTGALSIPRREASERAKETGLTVGSSVTKKTTIVCVGDQDLNRLDGHRKSSKHRKAEQLATNGQALRIIGESDFFRMINLKL